MMNAPVNKIIDFSNVDGPGNRTSIFFQGCSFDCMFCHNPETIHLCRNCGACVDGCPARALSRDAAGAVCWDPDKCVECDQCIRACPWDASPRIRLMTVEEVMRRLRRTMPYIDGITASGGECTLQNDFLIALFTLVQQEGKSCLLDSNGSFDFEADPRILRVCDGVMLDVKAVSPAWSQLLISAPPDLVLRNLDYLLSVDRLQEVRTVIFPHQDRENEETVRYVASRIGSACDYRIIRYRPFGVREKYQRILGEETTPAALAEQYAELARSLGAAKAYVV